MNQSCTNKPTGRIEPERFDGPGPLQRRILAGSRELQRPAGSVHGDSAADAVPYATIALLDGTVVGRLECHEALGQVVLGRSSLADIQIHDQFIHRVHSEIHWDTETRSHIITHAGGSNGTYVNLQRIDGSTRLVDGARIRVGKTELVYRRVYYPGS